MLPRNDLDRIQITFDDHRLVANAGLILPTWACSNWLTSVWTWAMRRAGRTPATR